MTLPMIGEKVNKSAYASSIDFEKDMFQLFYNGRRYFETGTAEYGGVVTLQRMYQYMTQSVESAKEDVPDEVAAQNYASLRLGPCEDQGEGQGEAPSEGEKEIMPYLRYKGQTISVGNWVHLSNPTDPSRPIIAQVFKTRSEDLGEGRQDWITACWFLRPEQTKHPRSMLFWPDEALKTSQFVEHHVEDVLEMVCVMYYTKYLKGRPAEGEGGWRQGDPLYVCENRFHAEKDQFYKIKNWSGVMPEEVRSMPL
jgi:chromatin structure-remodeling complex subunit RSC1/2